MTRPSVSSRRRARSPGAILKGRFCKMKSMPTFLTPKLVTTLKTYDRVQLTQDLLAGLIVGVVAIPLALAFGIASGVTPAEGLYSAVIGGFIISLLGGSRVQIGGPTGAFV